MKLMSGPDTTTALVMLAISVAFSGRVMASDGITVTDVFGHFATGDTVTINGVGFGAKSPALPLLWDDFEGHPIGAGIGDPIVGSYSRIGITVYTDANSYSGQVCAYSNIDGTGGFPGLVANWVPNEAKDAFASMKFKIVSSYGSVAPHNIKLLRLNAHDPDPTHGYPNFNIGNECTQTTFKGIINHGLLGQIYFGGFGDLPNPTGWNSLSIWDHMGDPDTANGFAGRCINDQVNEIHDRITLQSGHLGGLRSAFFCGYISHEGHDVDLYLDDLYADTSLARVEIYADTGFHEMQVPIAWSDGSISVICNSGSYAPGTEVQLVVYDADGNVSPPFSLKVAR
ncbi:MAG: hypothetical protein KAY24_16555 [Candidatus Eisenbacteria sp.]|nr:hypothetical protein [Candidatus Eisenbacteria bacterium]